MARSRVGPPTGLEEQERSPARQGERETKLADETASTASVDLDDAATPSPKVDAAYERFFRQQLTDHGPVLRRYACRLARTRDRADDLFHDAIRHAIERRHQWTPTRSFKAWFRTILRTRWSNAKRKGRSDPVAWEQDVDAHEPEGAAPPVQDRAVPPSDLEKALATLPEEQRDVILLAAEDCSYAEIAEELGIPIGTVMSRLARARAKVRQFLLSEES